MYQGIFRKNNDGIVIFTCDRLKDKMINLLMTQTYIEGH